MMVDPNGAIESQLRKQKEKRVNMTITVFINIKYVMMFLNQPSFKSAMIVGRYQCPMQCNQ